MEEQKRMKQINHLAQNLGFPALPPPEGCHNTQEHVGFSAEAIHEDGCYHGTYVKATKVNEALSLLLKSGKLKRGLLVPGSKMVGILHSTIYGGV
jgi:hypothetical protein